MTALPAEVFVANEQSSRPVDCARWAALAEAALAEEGVGGGELSVLFVDEATIASLNERFLGHPGPTDVLSFPIDEVHQAPERPAPASPGGWRAGGEGEPGAVDAPVLLGDVVICPEVAWRNAPGHAGSYDDELALLLVHGILHLLGHDHGADAEAEAMEAREQELLGAHHLRDDPLR